MEIEGQQYIRQDQLRGFIDNFINSLKFQDHSLLFQKRGLKTDHVADIEEFLESREFLGLKRVIRPAIKDHFLNVFGSGRYYVEILCTGAIGTGKNFFARGGLAYCIYLLGNLHNPQLEFDLAPGSSIYFIIQSRTETLARRAFFHEFVELIKDSPWFRENFMFDTTIHSELRFPHNIYVTPFGGQDTAALGLNVVGGVIDEVNSMLRVEDSKMVQFTGESEYDQATRIYNTISRRMTSRYQMLGRLPGKLFLLGSVQYPGDFTSRKKEAAEKDPTVYVMDMSQWESLPEKRFSGEKFLVEVGNDYKQSRIVEAKEQARDEGDVIEVPVEYKQSFEKDIEGALRDLAGIATSIKHSFIPYREKILAAQEQFNVINENQGLFFEEEWILPPFEDDIDPDWERIVNNSFIENLLDDPEAICAAHLDVGISGDAAGLSVGHIVGYRLLPVVRVWNDRLQTFNEIRDSRAPMYQIDGSLRIKASRGSEVDMQVLRDLVLYLRERLNIRWATTDSYQSVMLLQSWRRAQMRAGTLSVDTNLGPYAELKNAIKEERIRFRGDWLIKELRELQKDGDKVDHPPNGSKDLADSVAGVVYMLQHKEANYGRTRAAAGISRRSRRVSQRMVRQQEQILVPQKQGQSKKGSRRARRLRVLR